MSARAAGASRREILQIERCPNTQLTIGAPHPVPGSRICGATGLAAHIGRVRAVLWLLPLGWLRAFAVPPASLEGVLQYTRCYGQSSVLRAEVLARLAT